MVTPAACPSACWNSSDLVAPGVRVPARPGPAGRRRYRLGSLLRPRGQDARDQPEGAALKFEILVPVISLDKLTAVASFSGHRDHFSSKFGIRNSDDTLALRPQTN